MSVCLFKTLTFVSSFRQMLSCYHLTASMHWVIHERVCHKAAVNLLKHPDEVLLFREEHVFLRIKMGLQYALSYYQKFRLDERDACFLNHVVTSAKLQSMRERGRGRHLTSWLWWETANYLSLCPTYPNLFCVGP